MEMRTLLQLWELSASIIDAREFSDRQTTAAATVARLHAVTLTQGHYARLKNQKQHCSKQTVQNKCFT